MRLTCKDLADKIGCSDSHVRMALINDQRFDPQEEAYPSVPSGKRWTFADNPAAIDELKAKFSARAKPKKRAPRDISADALNGHDPMIDKIRARDLWSYDEASKVLRVHTTTINKNLHRLNLKALSSGKIQMIPADALLAVYNDSREAKAVAAQLAANKRNGHSDTPGASVNVLKRLDALEKRFDDSFKQINSKIDALMVMWR